ncbi:MAG: hypothetical protein JXB04_06205 [Kiritimatiellae bacterium]|nr:hypothetical protein [Kiritimatiellia bacterium]
MKDVSVAIRIGSPQSTVPLVRRTLESIAGNIGDCRWQVLLSIGENIPADVADFTQQAIKADPSRLILLERAEVTWAQFINRAIDASEGCEYFIKSHDDIELLSPDYLPQVRAELERIGRDVGWVSISDDGWKFGDFSPSVRLGYHIDLRREHAWERKKVLDLHTLPDNWWRASAPRHLAYRVERKARRILHLPPPAYPKPNVAAGAGVRDDLPQRTVRCHAPFNHFVLIRRETLLKLGPCEDWGTKNALLVDEDWGLRALQLNLPNIWIPHLRYLHHKGPFEGGGTRSGDEIGKEAGRVDEIFFRKWGFHSMPSDGELEDLCARYAGTLIPWSASRRSYEWDYI